VEAKLRERVERQLRLTQTKAVKKKRLRKAAKEEGISPSTSSKPFDSHQTSSMPIQSLYSIKTIDVEEKCANVLIINEDVDSILSLFTSIKAPKERPPSYERISKFVYEHQRHKSREYRGESSIGVVGLMIFDVPEGLPIPGLHRANEIPSWNKLKISLDKDGRNEYPWIRSAFTFADEWVCDDGTILVFYPDSVFISNKISTWAK